jgi:hypothetical protein
MMTKNRDKTKIYDYMERFPCCVISGKPVPSDYEPHHWKTVGAGGSDDDSNLDRLLPKYHKEAHRIGVKEIAIKYALQKPRNILIARGNWSIEDDARFNENIRKIGKFR